MYRKTKRKVRKYRKWVYGFLAVVLLLTMIPIFPERVSAAAQEIIVYFLPKQFAGWGR